MMKKILILIMSILIMFSYTVPVEGLDDLQINNENDDIVNNVGNNDNLNDDKKSNDEIEDNNNRIDNNELDTKEEQLDTKKEEQNEMGIQKKYIQNNNGFTIGDFLAAVNEEEPKVRLTLKDTDIEGIGTGI